MKQRMQKLAAGILTASMILGMSVNAGMPVRAEETSVGTADLSDQGTKAPDKWGATPSPNQYKYQKEELAAFCHFGPNTYSGYEWGFDQGSQRWLYEGQTPAQLFPLSNDFDAETLVTTLQNAGFKKLIVTAKHHDGFCIWNSKWTEYDVAGSDYKNGEGDILAEISAACTEHNMDMGLYMSPWDVAEPSYGYFDENGTSLCNWNGSGTGTPKNGMTWEEMEEADVLDYNEYYNNQLEEILSSPKYGNDGHFVEVWMDGAKGDRSKYQEYDFVRWFQTIQKYEGIEAGYEDDCLLFGAQAYTTVRWIGNEKGLANEENWAQVTADKTANDKGGTINSYSTNVDGTNYTMGSPNGNHWTVPEADARITSGWFWGNNKKAPKSLDELSNMYFNSVGHNATLLLNIPPNPEGKVDQAILERIEEFGSNVQGSFADNLAKNAVLTASEVRGNDIAFSPEKVLDGDDATYWTMNDDTTTGSITFDLGESKAFDLVTIEEAIQLGQRISGFKVEYRNDTESQWQTFAEGTTIGAKRICRNKKVRARFLKISITGSHAVPLISEIGVYKATEAFEDGAGIPEGLELTSVTDRDTSDGVGFTYNTGDWTAQSGSGFIGENSMYAGSDKEATLTFSGSKVWLYGTKDPGHGSAEIYIDDVKVSTINTRADIRGTGQMIFESEDLEDKSHTLRIVTKGTIGLDAAVVLNNGGKGMLQFEKTACVTEEDTETEVVVKRIGGSNGTVTAFYTNNPGSAVQGHYDVDGIRGTLTFENGETKKSFKVRTTRFKGETGDLSFTVDLESAGGGAILGFHTSMKFTIRDLDDPERLEEAKDILKESQALNFNLYTSEGQSEVQKLTAQLDAYLKAGDLIQTEEIIKTAAQLQAAKAKLTVRENYTAEDPFVFPVNGETKILEAELFTLDSKNVVNATQYVRITERADASNGKEVNWFENGNRIILPFTAAKAGTYEVTATYRSGRGESNPNAFEWSGETIAAGSLNVWGEVNAPNFHTAEFEIQVNQAGAGELIFTAGTKGGPVIDKFEIKSTEASIPPSAVTDVTLDPSELTLTDEQKMAMLYAVVLPENAGNKNVTFESSDPQIAEVTADGLVVSHQNGQTVITVTTEDGSKTAVCTVTVQRRDLESAALETALSNVKNILETGQGKYNQTVLASLKNKYEEILSKKDEADVNALKAMAEELQAIVAELDNNLSPETPVPPFAVTGVTLDPSELLLTDDQKEAMLNVTVLPENAANKKVTFESSDPQIAEVTADGLVVSHKNGQTVITVTTEDGSKTAVCTVTVQRYDLESAALETALSDVKKILETGQGKYNQTILAALQSKYEEILSKKDEADFDALKALAEELQAVVTELDNNLINNDKAKALNAPTGVKAVSTVNGVSVTFSPVANAASYDIYRASGSAAVKIASVKTASYLDDKAPGGKKSDYTVVAVSGQKNYTNSAASAAASVTLPKAAAKLNVKAVSGGVQISFKKVKGAKKYIILRAAKKDGPYKKIKVLKAKQTSFVDKKAKKGKNFYKVVTQKGKTYSPATKAKKASVKK